MKYEFTGKTKTYGAVTVRQIRRTSDNRLGGWLESQSNLSHAGSCWVSRNASVYGYARVYGDAQIMGAACVCDCADIGHTAKVSNQARVGGHTTMLQNSVVSGNAILDGHVELRQDVTVTGQAELHGTVRLRGHFGNTVTVSGNVRITGELRVEARHGSVSLDQDMYIQGEHYLEDGQFNNSADILSLTAASGDLHMTITRFGVGMVQQDQLRWTWWPYSEKTQDLVPTPHGIPYDIATAWQPLLRTMIQQRWPSSKGVEPIPQQSRQRYISLSP